MDAVSGQHFERGTRLGNWSIVRPIGEGTFGAVYEAVHVETGVHAALKVLHERLTRHPQALRRFLREAEAISSLRHPFIVDAYDVGEEIGVPYLAMEYLEGETLAARLAHDGPLSVVESLAMVLPIVCALHVLHTQSWVHRDVKPANIFLAQRPHGVVPKLLDFGIVKIHTEGDALTRTTALLGTPAYMSPEQANESKHVDARSDQWAIAVVLYECLTGRRPFGGSTLLEQLTEVASRPVSPLRASRPELPPGLDDVVLRALEKPPDARFVSVRQFGLALLPFAAPSTQEQLWPVLGDELTLAEESSECQPRGDLFASEGVETLQDLGEVTASIVPRAAPPRVPSPPTMPTSVDPVRVPVRPVVYGPPVGLLALSRVAPLVMFCVVVASLLWLVRAGSQPLRLPPPREPLPPHVHTSEPTRRGPDDPGRVVLAHLPPAPPPPSTNSPYERALHCRDDARDVRTENLCVIAALEGRAERPRERHLLANAYRAEGRIEDAERSLFERGAIDPRRLAVVRAALPALQQCLANAPSHIATVDAEVTFNSRGRPSGVVLASPHPGTIRGVCVARALDALNVRAAAGSTVRVTYELVHTSPGRARSVGAARSPTSLAPVF